MEIKASLNKPYTEAQRLNFITTYGDGYSPLNYEIRESDTALEAWGLTDSEVLQQAKDEKYQEANTKARQYLESGEALFPFEQGDGIYHIEATDGNIAKIGLKATALLIAQDFETTFPWNTKEDINIEINALEGKYIAEGLGTIQDEVWTVQFPAYIQQIEEATTPEEVYAIQINYSLEAPSGSLSE